MDAWSWCGVCVYGVHQTCAAERGSRTLRVPSDTHEDTHRGTSRRVCGGWTRRAGRHPGPLVPARCQSAYRETGTLLQNGGKYGSIKHSSCGGRTSAP
jgi:hypothetical protein